MKQVILLVDNDDEFLDVYGRLLGNEEYEVRLAKDPQEARTILSRGGLDLAIIDVRLEDDNDGRDISGINLAKEESFRHIPKIMITAFKPDVAYIRKLQELSANDLPAAITWIGKDELPERLLELIPKVISLWPQLQQINLLTSNISKQLQQDQTTVRQYAHSSHTRATIFSVMGFFLMFVGVILALVNIVEISIVIALGGIVTEVLGYLFFQRLDISNERMDRYRLELLQTNRLELLLATCEPLPASSQIPTSEYIIKAATDTWFSRKSVEQHGE